MLSQGGQVAAASGADGGDDANDERRTAMTVRFLARVGLGMAAALAIATAAEAQPAGAGQGWLGEFEHASQQLLQLADAIPAEKFAWRPAPGVRSISEVYMHAAIGNYFLLGQAGLKVPVDLAALGNDREKRLTSKADVTRFLKDSFDAVRASYPAADKQKAVTFFGKKTTVDGILLRLLVHNHEHMGQAVAYARMNGVAPPWSQTGGQ
jgi:uncharacterized damage-inducible protein DinB